MGDITSGVTIHRNIGPKSGFEEIVAVTAATADSGDTFTITLSDYGILDLWDVKGSVHTTANSVVIIETVTTSVTTGVLTITCGSGPGNTDKIRVYRITGSSKML